MTYTKPQILRAEVAVDAIQSTQQKALNILGDAVDPMRKTNPAYEADE